MISAVEKNWRFSSPSQIKTFNRCQRAWWWEKIAKLPVPTKPAAQLGLGLHGELEQYLLGTRSVGKLDPRLQPAVDFGYLPAPGTLPAGRVEARFQLPSSLSPSVTLRGVIDLLEPGRVTDHKTTSSFKYMKSEDELVHDSQCIIYSYHAVTERLTLPDGSVNFRHLYYLTRGGPEVREVEVNMTPPMLKEGWKEIVSIGKTMHKAAKLPVLEIEPNLDACMDYGGCPFRANCAATGVGSFGPLSGLFNQTKRGTVKMPGTNQMSFAERLQKRKASQEGEISVPLSLPGPQDINPPDGTPEFEQVSTDAPPVVKAAHPYAAIVSDVLQTPEDCRAYLLREAYAGIKKAPLVEVVQHFAKVLETEIESKGTKRHLLRRLYEAAGVPTPEALSEPTGREKLRAAAAQERAESEPETPVQAEPPPEPVEAISVEENTETATETALYINCLPRGVVMTYLDQLLPSLQAEVAEAAALPFYGLVEYNNGPKRVAALIAHRLENGSLELPPALYADRRTPCTDAVLEVLIPFYTHVIERT